MGVPSKISDWAAADPDRVAAIQNDDHVTYGELASGILYLRDSFAAQGVGAGAMAIVDVRSPLVLRMALYALRALGADVACIDRRAYMMQLIKLPRAVFVVFQAEIQAGTVSVTEDITVPVVEAPGSLRDEMRRPRDVGGDPIVLSGSHSLYSSGTTGPAKRVVLQTHKENLLHEHRAAAMGFDASSLVHMGRMGPWGVPGFRIPGCVWHIGGRVFFNTRPDTWADFTYRGITDYYTVPQALMRMLDSWPEDGPRVDGLRLFSSGGPLSAPLVRMLAARITRRIVNVYGCCEVPRYMMARAFDGEPSELNWLDQIPGSTLEIVRDDGELCAEGETGRLRCRLDPDDTHSYADLPEATAMHFQDGCFYPGDLAARRGDGRIGLAGREDDVLNIKGNKLPAAPLEAHLSDQLGVDTVCVFVGQDDRGAEILVVCIEGEAPVSKQALNDAAQSVAKDGRVAFSLHPSFPRGSNGMGKVLRGALRTEALEKIGLRDAATGGAPASQ
ncbi:MAG: AMP-binding protein [Pseudomonadota bacterium]